MTRIAFIGLLAVFSLIVGVANALAADRVFLGNTLRVPLTASADPGTAQTLGTLRQQAASRGTTRVIVGVRAAFAPEGLMGAASAAQQRDEIATTQSAVLDRVPTLRQKPETTKRFETIPFMAMEVTSAELEALVGLTEITSIQEDRLAAPILAQSVPLIGGTTAWANGYTGAGQAVAILDTGVDNTHPFLAGKVVSEACYSTNYAPQGASTVCPGGVTSSTAAGSAMPYASGVCPPGECDHGTHVAGIAAGNGASLPGVGYSGVAKDASVIAIQIFSRFDSATTCSPSPSPCALTYDSDQILGLQRVYALRTTYNIAAVNMSLGGGGYSSQITCDSDNASLKAAIDTLRAVNIATVIASGNNGYTSSLSAPGCISSAVSVGATWDATGYANNVCGTNLGTSSVDAIACFSNSASFLSLLAPGIWITSSVPGGGYATWAGTSMATPHVTGAWALVKQKSGSITVTDALNALTSTGLSVNDPRNSIVKPRIRIDAALSAIGGTGYTLTVAKSGTGSGTVTSNPAGIACGAACSAGYASGTPVSLTATPAAGSTFAGWSNACSGTGTCTVTMNSAISVTATFALADDGFPSGGNLPAGWVQPPGSNAPWVVTNDTTYAGTLSLKSGIIGNSQKSEISYTANFSAGNVSFARKVSSELNGDFLEFYIDGVLQNRWSGEVAWSVVSFPIAAGSHTLLWRYVKNGSVSSGSDAAWIDSVTLPATDGANVALASLGAVASASSSYSSAFPVVAVNNNERAGVNWANGGGWNDATAGSYPDWVQINFNGAKTINRVVVYTLQDNYNSPVEPTDTLTFSAYGVTDFTVQGWNGSAWVILGTVSGNNLVKRTVSFAAYTTDRIRVNITNALAGFSRITEIEAWGVAAASLPASTTTLISSASPATAGSTVTFTATVNGTNPGGNVNFTDGGTTITGCGAVALTGAGNSKTAACNTSSLSVGTHSIVANYTGDSGNAASSSAALSQSINPLPQAPAITSASSANFTVGQAGSFTFTASGYPAPTFSLSVCALPSGVILNGASGVLSGTPGAGTAGAYVCTLTAQNSAGSATQSFTLMVNALQTNVALASVGAVATASSSYSSAFPVVAVNNNERAGVNWGNGGGWNDATPGSYPDWVQINFNGAKTIDRVVVYTLQDNYNSPVEPTDTLTFSAYGVTDFTVQGWNGSAWVILGTVSGNNLVKRTVSFAAITTDRIRVNITNALASFSRITEIEAWGN